MNDELMVRKYMFKYGERIVFIKKNIYEFHGHPVYIYLCIDEDSYTMRHKKTMFDIFDDDSITDVNLELKKSCLFALLPSEDITENDLLPLYYTRQQVEQVFDITKNYADLLPIRVQSEERFAGHLLLCFIATAIMQCIQKDLRKRRSKVAKSINAENIWDYLRNQKCKVYEHYAIPQEARKEVNRIYEIFDIKAPYKIPIVNTTRG